MTWFNRLGGRHLALLLTWQARLLFGLAISLALGYYALRRFELGDIGAVFTLAHPLYVGLSLAGILVGILLKLLRWRYMFAPGSPSPGIRRLATALMLGQLGNALLPVRLGDVARIWALSRGKANPIGLESSLLTVVVEKAIDTVMLILILLLLSPFIALGPVVAVAPVPLFVAVVLILVAITVLAVSPRPRRQLRAWLGRLPIPAVRDRLGRLVDTCGRLVALRQPRGQLQLWGLTLLIWAFAGLVNHFGFLAVGLQLPFTAGLLLAVTEMGGSKIAFTPVNVGVYHIICIMTLSLFGVPLEPALQAAVLLHLIVYLPILLAGTLSALALTLDP